VTPALTREQQALCESMLHLVKGCAREARRKGSAVDLNELESAGFEALAIAAAKHDLSKGPFEPYAFACVRAGMASDVRKAQRWRIRAEPIARSLVPQDDGDDPPTVDEMLSRTMEQDRADNTAELRRRVGSYWTTILLHESLGDHEEDHLTARAMAHGLEVIKRTVETFTPEGRTYFRRFCKQERPIAEIAVELGVSVRTVGRLGKQVRHALDQALRDEGLLSHRSRGLRVKLVGSRPQGTCAGSPNYFPKVWPR
jgi:RNA polymerase sigma factor (sigma-70 family)